MILLVDFHEHFWLLLSKKAYFWAHCQRRTHKEKTLAGLTPPLPTSSAPSCSGGPDFWVSIKKFFVCKIDSWVEKFFWVKIYLFQYVLLYWQNGLFYILTKDQNHLWPGNQEVYFYSDKINWQRNYNERGTVMIDIW